MADLGVGILELCSPGYAEFASLTDGKQTTEDHRGPRSQVPERPLRAERAPHQTGQMIAWAKDIGMTQMGTASLSGQAQNGVATMDAVKRAADEYNKIGELAAKAGMVAVPARRGLRDGPSRRPAGLRSPVRTARPEVREDAVPDVRHENRRRSGDVLHEVSGTLHLDPLTGRGFEPAPGGSAAPQSRRAARRTAAPGRGAAGAAGSTGGGKGQRRLGQNLCRRQGRRREELLHRAELGSHGPERGLSEDAERLGASRDARRPLAVARGSERLRDLQRLTEPRPKGAWWATGLFRQAARPRGKAPSIALCTSEGTAPAPCSPAPRTAYSAHSRTASRG